MIKAISWCRSDTNIRIYGLVAAEDQFWCLFWQIVHGTAWQPSQGFYHLHLLHSFDKLFLFNHSISSVCKRALTNAINSLNWCFSPKSLMLVLILDPYGLNLNLDSGYNFQTPIEHTEMVRVKPKLTQLVSRRVGAESWIWVFWLQTNIFFI